MGISILRIPSAEGRGEKGNTHNTEHLLCTLSCTYVLSFSQLHVCLDGLVLTAEEKARLQKVKYYSGGHTAGERQSQAFPQKPTAVRGQQNTRAGGGSASGMLHGYFLPALSPSPQNPSQTCPGPGKSLVAKQGWSHTCRGTELCGDPSGFRLLLGPRATRQNPGSAARRPQSSPYREPLLPRPGLGHGGSDGGTVSPRKKREVLTPGTCECDLLWKQGLC